ncbi:hypothetical protein GCM10009122_21530 [Fulvivirga kasyanovii]|uniref:DUF2807 domain-containing protein n=1 Tax=Fulvivirga kasyanovii TaxID=396812 RepID=A0ABW9RVX2_9BACT|nr:head GIN domain-containing protein [Fulvivirga kasyanovii]MTI28138.1 DUF2807 domain-containing protein [Fulvivirga kasyanovii]
MKKPSIYLFAIFSFLFLSYCDSYRQERGNGNITSQEKEVEDFKELEIGGNYEVFLQKAEKPGLTIVADENLHEFIKIDQHGDVLEITSEATLKSEEGIKLYVDYVELMAINTSGAAVIKSDDVITGDYLRLEMSGAGVIDLEVELKALKINVSGAGAVELAGNVIEQNIQMSGAGGLEAYDLISQKSKIDISGVGGAAVTVKKQLEATVSGVGGISYRGNPEEVSTNVSGLGTVVKDEEEDEDI